MSESRHVHFWITAQPAESWVQSPSRKVIGGFLQNAPIFESKNKEIRTYKPLYPDERRKFLIQNSPLVDDLSRSDPLVSCNGSWSLLFHLLLAIVSNQFQFQIFRNAPPTRSSSTGKSVTQAFAITDQAHPAGH